MRKLPILLTAAVVLMGPATSALAQSADEIIEKSIGALGGRAAMEKLKSRHGTGSITLTSPAGDIKGTVEAWNAAPNKSRTVVKADLSQFGVGELVVDQRFDGTVGYVLDSMQGDREMTGGQLDAQRNAAFPHPFLTYKEVGTKVELVGKEKVGDREAHVLVFTPKSGPTTRTFIDAQNFMPLQTVTKVDVPQLGTEVEQTLVFSDYKEVDGAKIPFKMQSLSAVQSFTVVIDKVEHNTKVDEAMFSKPKQ